MRQPCSIRSLLQFLAFLSAMLVLGSVGAWDSGNITFGQMFMQIVVFTGLGFFCGRLSRRRLVTGYHRLPVTKRAPAPAMHKQEPAPAHAA